MARIYRDGLGVPHVRADSLLEVARAQGWVTARDRTWQLEWARRRACGTTAELVGEPGLAWDRFARRTRLVETARRALEALDEETRGFLAAYVEGLDAGLLGAGAVELDALGARAEPWEAWTPLAVFRAGHVLFASLGQRLLAHEPPPAHGSNAWAVGGGRTASGRPLIGGDPHRMIESPGVYMQVRLVCDDPDDRFDVAGFAFAGVPGVQHFAHAGDVAWAITNAMADTQDVHDEEDPPRDVVDRHVETVRVREIDGTLAEHEVDVVRTARGLVVEPGLSVRDAASELGELGFDALVPLLRARTVDDVDRALDRWVEPVNNVVVADVHGTVRYRIAGRVPVRDPSDPAGRWTGWLHPVPRHDVGPDGAVVTANERRGPESAAIGSSFAPPYRAERIQALLAGRDSLTPADFAAIHADTLLATVPLLTALVPGAFDDFDGRMDAASPQAGRFAAWRAAVVRRIAAAPALAALHHPVREHDRLFDPWLSVTARVAQALPQLVAAGAPFGLDLAALGRDALAEVDGVSGEGSVPWGERHVFAPLHVLDGVGRGELADPWRPPAVALSGDTDCVRCTGSYPDQSDRCYRGSVARYVWDLADREAGGWVVPTGASCDPGDEHALDQLPLWAACELAPIVGDVDRLSLEHEGEPVSWGE